MPAQLYRDHVFTSPQRFDWGRMDDVHSLVVLPQVTLEVLEEHSFTPEDLASEGHDVPEGEDEALEYAISEFREAPEFDDWRDGFLPVMTVLWPCQVIGNPEEAMAAIQREALACSIVKGTVNGVEISGIALTGGGMDLSDHIAGAYVLCGQIPPVTVLESALMKPSPHMEQELLAAAASAAEKLDAAAAGIRERLENRAGSAPRP